MGNKWLWRRGGVLGWGGPGRAQRRRKRLCLLRGRVAGSQGYCTERALPVWLCTILFTQGALRTPCLFLRLHCPTVSTKRASQQTCSVCTPSVRPHNRIRTKSAYSSHTTQARGVYFSLHSRRALCPLPSALSSYQVVLVSTEATGVPIPLFPGLASQACKCLPPTRCPSTP